MQRDQINGDGSNLPARPPSPYGRPPTGRPDPITPVFVRRVEEDAVGAMRWGLGKYGWLFALCVLVVAVLLPGYLALRPVENQATALVVAQRLDMDLHALPRFGEAVFDNGAVAHQVSVVFGAGGNAQDIIPDRVSMVAEQDSIVFAVTGHDPSSTTAADLANLAADTFVEQLNAPGEGVGLFTLQSRAAPPPEPAQRYDGLVVALPIAFVAGIILGLAVVAGVLLVRRPVLDADGAVEATGVPVLGTVSLPRTRDDDYPPHAEIPGIVPVCRRLLMAGAHTVVLVGPAGTAAQRGRLIVAMAHVLNLIRRVHLVVDADLALAAHKCADDGFSASTEARAGDPRELVLMDGSRPLDPAQLARETVMVLVVMTGTSTSTLRQAVVKYLGATDAGCLLVMHEHRSRRGDPPVGTPSPSGSGAAAPSRPAPDRVSAVLDDSTSS